MSGLDRLMRRVVKVGGCWEWTGARDRQGYGRVEWKGRTRRETTRRYRARRQEQTA